MNAGGEGPVTLAFPSALSHESCEELKAQLECFCVGNSAVRAVVSRTLANIRDPNEEAAK